MKKLSNYFVYAICFIAVALSTGAFIKANANNNSMPGQPVDLTYAAEKALPAVVHIKYLQNSKIQTVEMESDPWSDFDPFSFFFGNPGNNGRQQRKIQTPKREGADELTVTLDDNREFSARIIGTDKTTDLALIKIDGKNLPAITIGDSNNLKVGEWVLAVGNPFNLNSTVTAGIVSAKARSIGANGIESFIQTDAAINPGNSGGALVNTEGELVGINAMLVSQTGSFAGYGFAIPTTIMNKVVSDLKQYGTVQRAMIGVRGIDVNKYFDQMKADGKEVDLGTMEGAYIDSVEDGSAGAEAGLQKGDVIISIDGKKIKKMAELQEYLANKRPGDKVTVTYLRNKKSKTAILTLKNQQGNTNVVKNADLDVLGGNFREINDSEKQQLNISTGLVVMKINNGVLKDAGINRGFIIQKVNDIPMKTIDDLQKAVKEASTSKDPVLYIQGIYPTGKKGYFAVPLQND